MVKYYIKEGLIFSNIETKVRYNILNSLIVLKFNKDDFLNTNSLILDKFNEISKDKKEIIIKGLISEWIPIKEIDEKYIFRDEEDNYEFIESTSSIDILNSILKELKEDTKFKVFKSDILDWIKSNETIERKRVDKNEKKFRNIVKKKEDVVREYDEFSVKKLNPILFEISKLTESKNRFLNSIDSIKESKELRFNEIKINSEKNISKLNSNHEKISERIKKIDFEIEVLNKKVKILEEKLDLGVRKTIDPMLLILSLGLSYWTKFSNVKYRIVTLKVKINNKKEKRLEHEVRLRKVKKLLENRIDVLKKKEKEILNENENEEFKIGEIEKKVSEIELKIEKFEKKLRESKISEKTILEKIDRISKEEEEILEEKNLLDKFSCKNVLKRLKEVEISMKKDRKSIIDLRDRILKQKV